MQDAIPDLWPSEVDETAVMTPVAILRHQASLLRRRSHNVLDAEVVSDLRPADNEDAEEYAEHGLDVIVPALDDFRLRLLTVCHEKRTAYPVWIGLGTSVPPFADKSANSQGEFVAQLRAVLQSDKVRSTIHSMLAQANDATASQPASATK